MFIIQELTFNLKQKVSTESNDWQKRESVRAKMVMKQAEVLSDEWSHNEYDSGANAYAMNNSYDGELLVADDAKREYGEKGDG